MKKPINLAVIEAYAFPGYCVSLSRVVNQPVLSLVQERISQSQELSKIILLNTSLYEPRILSSLAKRLNLDFFRLNTENIWTFLVKLAEQYQADSISRIPEGALLIDWNWLDQSILKLHREKLDAILPLGLPKALGAEIYSAETLKKAVAAGKTPLIKYRSEFKIAFCEDYSYKSLLLFPTQLKDSRQEKILQELYQKYYSEGKPITIEQAKHFFLSDPLKYSQFLEKVSKSEKILIFRTGRFWHLEAVCQVLKKLPKIPKISLLTSTLPENWQHQDLLDKKIFFNGSHLTLKNLGWHNFIALVRNKYNLSVILYNNPDGKTYFQVDLLALLLSGKNSYFLDCYGDSGKLLEFDWWQRFTRRNSFSKVCSKLWQGPLKFSYRVLTYTTELIIFASLLFLFIPTILITFHLKEKISKLFK